MSCPDCEKLKAELEVAWKKQSELIFERDKGQRYVMDAQIRSSKAEARAEALGRARDRFKEAFGKAHARAADEENWRRWAHDRMVALADIVRESAVYVSPSENGQVWRCVLCDATWPDDGGVQRHADECLLEDAEYKAPRGALIDTPKMRNPLARCFNGCPSPPQPPSKTLCGRFLDKIGDALTDAPEPAPQTEHIWKQLKERLHLVGEELFQNGKELEQFEKLGLEARARQHAGMCIREVAMMMDLDDREKMLDTFMNRLRRELSKADAIITAYENTRKDQKS